MAWYLQRKLTSRCQVKVDAIILVRESRYNPSSFALSIRYGEWPYGFWSSVILLDKCGVLRRQCWDTNWNMKHVCFFLWRWACARNVRLRFPYVHQLFIFRQRKIIWSVRFSQVSYSIPCVWIRVSKMIVFFSNYHWDYHFNSTVTFNNLNISWT